MCKRCKIRTIYLSPCGLCMSCSFATREVA
jgi:hypothetical protein